jgi:NarL family two-component system response regulator YdfI
MGRRIQAREGASVFIIAASEVARAGIESLIASNARFTIVGSAPDLSGLAAQVAEDLSPDVVIMDAAGQPEEALSNLNAFFDEGHEGDVFPRFVVIGGSYGRWLREALLSGVVCSVLPRFASSEEIIAAVGAVLAGLVALDMGTVGLLLSSQNSDLDHPLSEQPDTGSTTPGLSELDALTPREREVLEMLAEGLANKEIAWRMKISEHTVKFHVGSIFAKLGVSTRTEAVMKGIRKGLVMM